MIVLGNASASRTQGTAMVGILVFFLTLVECRSGASIDRTAAQKVSDSFMGYLASDRVSDAVGEMEPEIFRSAGRQQVEGQVRKLFDYCGRPLDSEFKHDEIGFKVYSSHHFWSADASIRATSRLAALDRGKTCPSAMDTVGSGG